MARKLKKKKRNHRAVYLYEAIITADIARLLGNKEWKKVFVTLADRMAPGPDKSLLMDLSATCNEAVLDATYSIMR